MPTDAAKKLAELRKELKKLRKENAELRAKLVRWIDDGDRDFVARRNHG